MCAGWLTISLAALYFVGGVRVTFSTGIAAGGNLAYWTSYLVTMVFTFITAAVIAEVCSASPSAGSIYIWAAEAGGPRFGRLLGFVVAWWSTTAWTTFCASTILTFFPIGINMVLNSMLGNTQAAVNYMLAVRLRSTPTSATVLTPLLGTHGVQCRLSTGH
jgi:amino acid transporter